MHKSQITEKLNHRFCKDMNLPISLHREPYFSARLDLYAKTLYPGVDILYNSYLLMLEDFKTEQVYFEYYTEVKESMINAIKESEGYKRFNEEDMSKFSVPEHLRQLPSKDIFKPTFNRRRFLSFDMKKANFSSMHHYDSTMFRGFDIWEGFIRDFTDKSHIIRSKYIREVVLGNCNPKRHITYEKFLMSQILEQVIFYSPTVKDRIVFFSNDEIIVDVTGYVDSTVERIRYFFDKSLEDTKFSIELRSTLFDLYHIPELDGYVEVFWLSESQRSLVPKKINNFMMPFLCKALIEEDVQLADTVFIHPNHGLLSRFIEYPKVNLPEEVKEAFSSKGT